MESERLRYSELSIDHLDSFHRLVQDVHVRRYLLDGEVLPREWSAERIRESRSLFERRGVLACQPKGYTGTGWFLWVP
jgi:hypothetical protein